VRAQIPTVFKKHYKTAGIAPTIVLKRKGRIIRENDAAVIVPWNEGNGSYPAQFLQ